MRKHSLTLALFVLLLAMGVAPGQAQTKKDKPTADVGGLAKETLQLKISGGQTEMAMWFPTEFFVESALAEGKLSRAEAEENAAVLKPYLILIVQCAMDAEDGTPTYLSESQVRERVAIKTKGGTLIKPVQKVPPTVSAIVAAMKSIIASDGGEGNANLHIIAFPAKDADGKLIVAATQRDKLTLLLHPYKAFKPTEFVWHTPFDTLSPAAQCPQCKEGISAKWTFCPWCGAKLVAK